MRFIEIIVMMVTVMAVTIMKILHVNVFARLLKYFFTINKLKNLFISEKIVLLLRFYGKLAVKLEYNKKINDIINCKYGN